VYARLSKALSHMCDEAQTIMPKVTHNTLAQIVGASREMVSKLMKDLEKGGYVQSHPDRLVLCKRLPAKW
jgi:CRP/FNR family cyclic AMP-dependent transcriptional regulator